MEWEVAIIAVKAAGGEGCCVKQFLPAIAFKKLGLFYLFILVTSYTVYTG
jgi:hypothetical protein